MIKAVFFDFDGVLTTEPYGLYSTASQLCSQYNMDQQAFEASYNIHFRKRDDEAGRVCEAQWEKICSDMNAAIPYEEMLYAMGHPPKNEPVVAFVRTIREKGFITGLITDNPVERAKQLSPTYEFDALFDVVVVSGAVGSRKVEKHIFNAAFTAAQVAPSESIFIDNTEKNLVAPAAMGVTTYFHDQEKNDIAAMQSFLQEHGVL